MSLALIQRCRVKKITDPTFRYRPSYATDLRKTFSRLRRTRKTDAGDQPKDATVHVLRRPSTR